MKSSTTKRLGIIAALAGTLLVLPAMLEAQGRGNGNGNRDKNRPELIRRDDDRRGDQRRRDKDRRRDDDRQRYDDRGRRNDDRGPAFCRNGQGHPVHGMRWCRDKGFGDSRWEVFERNRRDDRRYDRRNVSVNNRSYERAHQEFHYRHDRECRLRAAERPLDLQWQLRVRAQCSQRHDDWHYRMGRAHR